MLFFLRLTEEIQNSRAHVIVIGQNEVAFTTSYNIREVRLKLKKVAKCYQVDITGYEYLTANRNPVEVTQ